MKEKHGGSHGKSIMLLGNASTEQFQDSQAAWISFSFNLVNKVVILIQFSILCLFPLKKIIKASVVIYN